MKLFRWPIDTKKGTRLVSQGDGLVRNVNWQIRINLWWGFKNYLYFHQK